MTTQTRIPMTASGARRKLARLDARRDILRRKLADAGRAWEIAGRSDGQQAYMQAMAAQSREASAELERLDKESLAVAQAWGWA